MPESWRLPSILSATTQIGQIGPLLFLIFHALLPRHVTFIRTIYVVLVIGALSCLLLVFFWSKTAFIFGEERSIGIYILNFSLALLDGTSSVTFLPFIGSKFVKEYIVPNYIGESFAALIPSVLSLIQNIGKEDKCHNVTRGNETFLEPVPFQPTYSVSVYFLLMFLLLVMSTIAFSLVVFSKTGKQERKRARQLNEKSEKSEKSEKNVNEISTFVGTTNHKSEKIILLTITGLVSFTCYGILPAFQSYSALPYGNQAFNLSVNLSYLLLPISIIFTIWSYECSVKRICIEFSLTLLVAIYIIVIGCLSPCPPLIDSWFGAFLIVLAWIVIQTMFLRVRCLAAARLERFGKKMLLFFGALTMGGQFFGGIAIYIVVDIYKMLKEKPQCVFDTSYCH